MTNIMFKCVVPENIHTSPMEGLENSEGKRGLIVENCEQKISCASELHFDRFPPISGFREWSLWSYSHLFFILVAMLLMQSMTLCGQIFSC